MLKKNSPSIAKGLGGDEFLSLSRTSLEERNRTMIIVNQT
ncbi:MAG: hypothetical protein ACI86H_003074, partial [bacterium]